MILKQLRLSRNLSQEQLANMSGLNVRTIQRIESGQKASTESVKCIAAALDVDISTLNKESYVVDTHSPHWKTLPFGVKAWFFLNFLEMRPKRRVSRRIEILSHFCGFLLCLLGVWNQAALAGGLFMLANAYWFHMLIWQGDRYGIWYDGAETPIPAQA